MPDASMGDRSFMSRETRAATHCLPLRPTPLCLVTTVGCALHRHRTCSFRSTCSAFQDARCYTQRLNLRLQTRDLGLEDGDLVFFLFYRVIYIRHWSRASRANIATTERMSISTQVHMFSSTP